MKHSEIRWNNSDIFEDNNMPRSAVKVPKRGGGGDSTASSSYAAELDQRALDLEHQLSLALSTSSGANESKATQIRVPLCECLSDLILTDTAYAVQHNVCDRLWRKCFYDRIGPLRSRVARARKQSQKHKQEASAAAAIVKAEESLGFAVAEAVTLYDYLCDKLKAMLLEEEGKTAFKTSKKKQKQQKSHRNKQSRKHAHAGSGGASATTESIEQDDTSSYASTSSALSSVVVPRATSILSRQTTKEKVVKNKENAKQSSIVECLHRLYVHLGDLFRYSNNLQKAEAAYQRSARLGPGHGNPYNQLAVLCQVKDGAAAPNHGANTAQVMSLSAVALFWYARSLLATTEVFATSQSNLMRLFSDNHDWLVKQKEQQQLDAGAAVPIALPSKSMQSRRFLAQYVDLHRHLFRGVGSPEQQDNFLSAVHDQVNVGLTELLQNLALGDSLLCKMITIQAFGECWQDYSEYGADDENKNSNLHRVQQLTFRLARLSTLTLGQSLAQRVTASLEKAMTVSAAKSTTQTTVQPSLRLVAPLLLLTEYLVAQESANKMKLEKTISTDELDHKLIEAMKEYWQILVNIWNIFQNAFPTVTSSFDDDETLDLKEYRSLRGFSPFASFLPPLQNGFLNNAEAIEALELRKNEDHKSSAQDERSAASGRGSASLASMTVDSAIPSSSVCTSSNNKDTHGLNEQSRIKVARMLMVAERLASDNQSELGKCIHKRNGIFAWVDAQDHSLADENGDTTMMDFEHDDINHNVDFVDNAVIPPPIQPPLDLVYQPDASGGPALLVPGALLQTTKASALSDAAGKTGKALPSDSLMTDAPPMVTNIASPLPQPALLPAVKPMIDTLQQQQQPSTSAALSPPASLLPPPGFGHSSSLSTPFVSAATRAPPVGLALPVLDRLASAPLAGSDFVPIQQSSASILDSLHLFGGPSSLQTNNPFVSNIPTYTNPFANGSGNHDGMNAFTSTWELEQSLFQDAISSDGSNLLDSGLLSSLLTDESPTKSRNPFAT